MRTLHALGGALKGVHPVLFTKQREARMRLHLSTDASADGDENGGAQMGVLQLDEEGVWRAWSGSSDLTGVAELEMLAGQMSGELGSERVIDKLVIASIDSAAGTLR